MPKIGEVTKLNELEDVQVPSPSDDEILYWDDGESKWKSKAIALVLPDGTTTGDIIRWNDGGFWEVKEEPLEFDHIKLTPQAAAPTPIDGGLYYDSVEKAAYIGVAT